MVVPIIIFQNYQKFRSNIFFIMNNTPGNAQRQGAEPRRASTLNAFSNPKPHFHCKHSNFWFLISKGWQKTRPKINQKKNRPFGLVFSKNDKQDVIFSNNLKKFSPISSDYIKTDKSFSSCFFVFFFKDSKSRINILCPSEDFLENKIISVHSNEFIIDTLSRENSPNFIFDKHSGYYDLTVQDYSTMKCMDGFVSLAHRDSPYTPLCSVRRSE